MYDRSDSDSSVLKKFRTKLLERHLQGISRANLEGRLAAGGMADDLMLEQPMTDQPHPQTQRAGNEVLSSAELPAAARGSGRKGKIAPVIQEVEGDMQEDDGHLHAARFIRVMAKRGSVLEEEESKTRAEKSIASKEVEVSSDMEVEKKFACDDDVEEDTYAVADKYLLWAQFDDISDKPKYIILKELDSKTMISLMEESEFSYEIPERGTKMMTFQEGRQQLVIKREGTLVRKTFRPVIATVVVLHTIVEALKEGVTITNHDLFRRRKEVFEKIEVSHGILYDVCCMLGCTMSSLNVVSVAKGSVIGPLTLRCKDGYSVNCSDKSFGGMRIPNNALEAKIEVEKHEADFILVLEKSYMFHHLCQMDFHTENKCIMITRDGEPNVATRAFLKMLVDVTQLKTYALVDPDAHGVQTLCTYAFGSMEMADDRLGLEVRSICWLGILPRDLASLTVPDRCYFSDFSQEEQWILKSVLKHRCTVLPKLWIKKIKQLASENTKASFESLFSLGFGYLLSKQGVHSKAAWKGRENLIRC